MALGTPSVLASGNQGTTDPGVTASFSPTESICWLGVYSQLTGAPPTVVGVTGVNGTWSSVGTVASQNNNRRVSVLVGTGCSGTGTLSIDMSAAPTNGAGYVVWEVSGVDLTTQHIASNVKTNGGAASQTSIAVTPNSLASVDNAYVVVLNHGTAEDTIALHGSATEFFDGNAASVLRLACNWLVGWSSGDMGASWATAQQAEVVGFEMNAAAGAAGGAPVVTRRAFLGV